jgi:predicted transcriptional regulator
MTPSQITLSNSHLIQIINENPGIHYSKIRRLTELSNGTIQRKLKQLEESKTVKVFRDPGRTRYFTKTFSESYFEDMSLLHNPTIKNIMIILLEHNKLSFKEIVQKSTKSQSTISSSLSVLVKRNILKKDLDKNNSISYSFKNKKRIEKILQSKNVKSSYFKNTC